MMLCGKRIRRALLAAGLMAGVMPGLPPASLSAAENRGQAELVGGTVEVFPRGSEGLIKTTDQEYLAFITRAGTLQIQYQRVNLLEYGQDVSRRYAMAILISPVLILSKKRKHFLTIGYVDNEGRQQALLFLVGKNDIRAVLASLEARTGRKVEYQDIEARKAGPG